MRKFILPILILTAFISPVYAEINIGAETRVRGITCRDNNFYNISADSFTATAYFQQRTRVYLEGTLADNVSVNTSFQSIGKWNETTDLFFETAYIKFSRLTTIMKDNFQLDFTAGRMPIEYGNGIAVRDADSATGFNALKADFTFRKDASLEVFGIAYSTNSTVLGGVFNKIWKKDMIKQYFYSLYQIRSDDANESGLFVGSRVYVNPKPDVSYSVEFAKEIGGKGMAFDAGIDLTAEGIKIKVLADLLYGNSDFSLDTAWLDYHIYGEYFISNRSNFGYYDNKLRNLTIIRVGGTYNEIKNLVLGVNMFFYRDDGGGSIINTIVTPGTYDAGTETDFYAIYNFSSNTRIRLIIGLYDPGTLVYYPGKSPTKDDFARKLLLECQARF